MADVQTRNGLYGFEFRDVDRRRVDPAERKTYDIKGLWQRHHEIARLAVRGYKQTDIAEILNIDPQTVSNTLNSELGQHKVAELRLESDNETKKVSEKIRILTSRAIQIYSEIFDSPNATIKEKKEVADTVVLELSGHRVPTKLQAHHVSTTLTIDELEEFKKRGIAAAREAGLIVDIEPLKVSDGNGNGDSHKGNGNGNGSGSSDGKTD